MSEWKCKKVLCSADAIIQGWLSSNKKAFVAGLNNDGIITVRVPSAAISIDGSTDEVWSAREKLLLPKAVPLLSSHTIDEESHSVSVYVSSVSVATGKVVALGTVTVGFNAHWSKVISYTDSSIFTAISEEKMIVLSERMVIIANSMISCWLRNDEQEYKKYVSPELRLVIPRFDLDVTGVKAIWKIRQTLQNLTPYLLSSHTVDFKLRQVKAWQQRVSVVTGKVEYLDEVLFQFDDACRVVTSYQQKNVFGMKTSSNSSVPSVDTEADSDDEFSP